MFFEPRRSAPPTVSVLAVASTRTSAPIAAAHAPAGSEEDPFRVPDARGCARSPTVRDHLGSTRVGNLADLVLLEANPLEDVANVSRIHAVISRGVYCGPEERERLVTSIGARKR